MRNINSASFIQQLDIFFECNETELKKSYSRNDAKKHDREIGKLKRIIGEIAITNDTLKKC